MKTDRLFALGRRIRHSIITSTTAAKSGHPSSSLSAVELLSVLFFDGFFKQDIHNFQNPFNDKLVLSKGHAAPLLYSIYEAAGVLSREELLTLRKFDSRLQGHPTPAVPFVDVTTGSLGQGLSVGVGMALGFAKRAAYNAKRTEAIHDVCYTPRVFVLLGDSEFAEGQNYEAMQLASHYRLGNLIAILDVNRLGQRGETQLGWDLETYKKRAEAFGWNAIIIEDGNTIAQVQKAYSELTNLTNSTNSDQLRPTIIIAKTKKGAGVSFMEDKDNWHGKPIPQAQLELALKDIGAVDFSIQGVITKPDSVSAHFPASAPSQLENPRVSGIPLGLSHLVSSISTREAYGYAMADLAKQNPSVIVLDAETSNSTYAEFVKKETPEQFVECFIAEQNMIGMALGLSKVGYIPFASSFAAFLSRAFDQIRMSQYSIKPAELVEASQSMSQLVLDTNSTNSDQLRLTSTINIVGSHAGCSIGVDGASQMALEDIAMMRSIRESTVLYPSDGISAYKLTQEMAHHPGINYLRTTREKTPILYGENEEFPIGGFKIIQITNNKLQISNQIQITNNKINAVVVSAGITLHEALKAQRILEEKQIHTIVVDLYSVKPLDSTLINRLIRVTKHLVVVEDHYEAGGIGEAVLSALSSPHDTRYTFTHLCVRKEPRSGAPAELLHYEEIDADAIVKSIVNDC